MPLQQTSAQFNTPASSVSRTNAGYVSNDFIETGKKSFLVYTHNKYLMVPTESIAFFYVKYEATLIVTFEKQEYSVKYSLEQLQRLLPVHQFFRLNRQFLISCKAIKEVEHYFARKLLVKPVIPFAEKLLVSREKARIFLDWLECR